jgi:hypothetical protein
MNPFVQTPWGPLQLPQSCTISTPLQLQPSTMFPPIGLCAQALNTGGPAPFVAQDPASTMQALLLQQQMAQVNPYVAANFLLLQQMSMMAMPPFAQSGPSAAQVAERQIPNSSHHCDQVLRKAFHEHDNKDEALRSLNGVCVCILMNLL